MALIIETGAGIPGADSYADEVYAAAFLAAHGYRPFVNAEQSLRRGTRYIELVFGRKWPGQRTKGREQGLSWPRKNVLDGDGNLIPEDEVPNEVMAATVEAGRLVGPDGVLPATARLQKSITVGPISIEYADTEEATKIVPLVEGWLEGLLLTTSGSATGWLRRA